MPKTIPRFNVGDKVRVRPGVSDPDYDDLTIGGWTGTVAEIQSGTPPTFLVGWSTETLKNQGTIYRNRCERDGLDSDEMWLEEGDLEPDTGGPVQIEQPSNVVTKPLSMDEQDDRIRAMFGLTSDDPLPDVDGNSLAVYHEHLAKTLSFPFETDYFEETGPFEGNNHIVKVNGLMSLDDYDCDEMYGLMCKARLGKRQVCLPLVVSS